MEGIFGRYLSSPLFTFTVGAEKKEITVHSSAFASLSQSLDALINGEMIEAKTRHVDWSEVDVDTFARLCEFAYCRNYTPPSFRLIDGKSPRLNVSCEEAAPAPPPETEWEPEEPKVPEAEAAPEPTHWYGHTWAVPPDAPDPEIPYKERRMWTKQLRNGFAKSLVVPGLQSDDLDYTFTPPQNTGSWEDFAPVFLGQAQLYVLADKYGIEPLRRLILSKLYQTLETFKLYDTGVGGIIEFVRFVYLNTPPNYNGKMDAMRNLATRYIVSVLGQIGENECFRELLEEGGPFVADFWHIVWGGDHSLYS